MEENLINPQSAQPTIQPVNPVAEKTETSPKSPGKRKDFLIGLLFGLAGAIVLALLDLLFIALANLAQDTLISLLIFGGPLLILGLYVFLTIYFFKRRRNIFWGLLTSFFVFIILAIIIARII